jgi:hypothetical protein
MKAYFFLCIVLMALTFNPVKKGVNKNKPANTQVYSWHMYNLSGTAELVPAQIFYGTESGARIQFGCPPGITVICARAYDIEGNPLNVYIKKSPF